MLTSIIVALGIIASTLIGMGDVPPEYFDCPECVAPTEYLEWYYAGDPCADTNKDGNITVQDWFSYLADFQQNCLD